eukprot:TRINITY_DN14934_c0_g1_i1.p1 TRINITY_DN14934_c0_g1~~TRINITY_DN14934_c0_g1_i1.p1  ORF type:complete len:477 (-),score=48.18 TRINITY_DN14934_c0_g1_i1:174-1604(-)
MDGDEELELSADRADARPAASRPSVKKNIAVRLAPPPREPPKERRRPVAPRPAVPSTPAAVVAPVAAPVVAPIAASVAVPAVAPVVPVAAPVAPFRDARDQPPSQPRDRPRAAQSREQYDEPSFAPVHERERDGFDRGDGARERSPFDDRRAHADERFDDHERGGYDDRSRAARDRLPQDRAPHSQSHGAAPFVPSFPPAPRPPPSTGDFRPPTAPPGVRLPVKRREPEPPVETKLVGAKKKAPIFCDICQLPIVVFCRFSPCQHVSCSQCVAGPKICPVCKAPFDKADVDEWSDEVQIFVCDYAKCRRSYFNAFSLSEHQKIRKHGSGYRPGEASKPPLMPMGLPPGMPPPMPGMPGFDMAMPLGLPPNAFGPPGAIPPGMPFPADFELPKPPRFPGDNPRFDGAKGHPHEFRFDTPTGGPPQFGNRGPPMGVGSGPVGFPGGPPARNGFPPGGPPAGRGAPPRRPPPQNFGPPF